MFNRYYEKAKKQGRRVIPFILAASMLLQTGMSNVALASDISGDPAQTQTEGEADPGQTQTEGEVQPEVIVEGQDNTGDAADAEAPARGAIDWTQQKESFVLSADKITYQEKDQKQTTVKNTEGKIDLSKGNTDAPESWHLFVRFAFDKEKMAEQLLTGDTFSFTVPKEYMTLTDTAEPVAASVCNQQAYEAEQSEIKDTEPIGTYTIKDNVVTFTVTETNIPNNLFGVIDLAFHWNTDKITTEGTACELMLQDGVKTQVQLPKKEAEVKEEEKKPEDPAGTEDTADKTGVTDNTDTTDKSEVTDNTDTTDKSEVTDNTDTTDRTETTDTTDKSEVTDTTDTTDKTGVEDITDETAAEDSADKSGGNIIKRFQRRIASFFGADNGTNDANQNYAGGTKDSHVFGKDDLPEAFSQVKVTVYNKNGGYQTGDDRRVQFKFDLTLDEDYLYTTLTEDLENRPDYPTQGSLSEEEYTKKVGEYLQGLQTGTGEGKLPPLVYTYDLGKNFRSYNAVNPVELLDATGMYCGKFDIKGGIVTFTFDASCYLYDDIIASISMEAYMLDATLNDKPQDVVFDDNGELVFESTETSGGGTGETEDKNYYIEKEAPLRVADSEIEYTIKAGVTKNTEKLNGLSITDTLPDGLEIKSVKYGEKELTQGKDFTYDSATRTFTYPFKNDGDPVTDAKFTIAAKLTDTKYQDVINKGGIDENFTNKAELKKDGETDPLIVSDEVTTNMKFNFLSKEGKEEQLNGTRYSWTITANTQLPYLEYGYLIDTLCWTDHQYDFKQGITVHTSKDGVEDVTYTEIPEVKISELNITNADGNSIDFRWGKDLTAEKLKTLQDAVKEQKEITGPFYYLYDTDIANPFYGSANSDSTEPEYKQQAVLVLPFDKAAGWTGGVNEQGELQQESLRVKYYTDLNMHGLSVDEYVAQAQNNSAYSPKITNDAALLWHNANGEGPGPHFPDEVTWDKGVDSNVKPLTKSGVSYNQKTQELTWKLDVNRCGASLKNVVIEDVLDAKYDLTAGGVLTINLRKYDQTSMTEVGPATVLTKAEDSNNMSDNTYAIVEKEINGVQKTVIKIKLGDLVSEKTGELKTLYCCTLNFKLKLIDGDYLAKHSTDQVVSNSANIQADLGEGKVDDTATAEIKVPNPLIDKTAVGSYDYATHKLTWQVEINPNKLPIKDAVITDTLPENITWDSSLKDILKDGESIPSADWTKLVTVSEDNSTNNSRTITFKNGEEINNTYTFVFESEVTNAWREANKANLSASSTTPAEVENTAKLDGTIYGETITDAEDKATHVVPHAKIDKSGVYHEDKGTIDWTVLMNVDQVNIQGMYLQEDVTVKDASGASLNVQELDVDSVKVEKVQVDQDGNVIKDDESKKPEEVSNPKLSAIDNKDKEPDYRGFRFYPSDDAQTDGTDYSTYRITFTTDLQADAKGAAIHNKVYLNDSSDQGYDESDESDGGYDGNFDADQSVQRSTRPKITMIKASSNSANLSTEETELLLGEAEFSLTAYTFSVSDKKITLTNEAERYDKVRLTDDSGKALFLNIKAASSSNEQLIYKLSEDTPPAGYDKVHDYYIIFSTSDTNYAECTAVVEASNSETKLTEQNYIVKKATSETAEETTAALTLTDTPVATPFTFDKQIAKSVQYNNGETPTYTYEALSTEGDVVFKVEPTGNLAGHVKTSYISNDTQGKFTISKLDPGTYTLTEVKSPTKVTIGAKFTLKVEWKEANEGNSGASHYEYSLAPVVNSEHNTEFEHTQGSNPVIKDGFLLGDFSFTKQVKYADSAQDNGTQPNGNVENLTGVAFQLKSIDQATPADTTTTASTNAGFVKTVISGADGKVSFEDIPVGEYTLEEGHFDADGKFVSGVTGYAPTDKLKVIVEEEQGSSFGTDDSGNEYHDKKVKVTYKKAEGTENQTLIDENNVYSNTAIKGTISFTKYSGAGNTGLTAFDNQPLVGAEFGLYRKIGNQTADKPTYKATSNADGKVEFTDVEFGDYVLKEITTPAGYIKVNDIELDRSQYTVTSGANQGDASTFVYAVNQNESGQGVVTNALKSYSLNLKKTDEDGNPLSGKTFQIYRRNSKAIDSNGGGLEVEALSGANVATQRFGYVAQKYYKYTPKASVTSRDDGKILLENLPYGDYLLVEDIKEGDNLQSTAGHPAVGISLGRNTDGSSKITVNMTDNLNPDYLKGKDTNSPYYELSGNNAITWKQISSETEGTGVFYPIENQLKYAYVQVNKVVANMVDGSLVSTDQPLAGATFAIYQGNTTEGTPYLTLTTDAKGNFPRNNDGSYTDKTQNAGNHDKHLFYGDYTIKEISAPTGYKTNTNSISFGIADTTCGHEGTVWIKTQADGTLDATAETKGVVNTIANDEKDFFGNALNRGAFSLKKLAAPDAPNKTGSSLSGAKFQILDQESVVAVLEEDKIQQGLYNMAEVPEQTANKAITKKVGGVDVPYLYNVATEGDPDYSILAGTYTVKEVTAPAGYETSNFTFTIDADGKLSINAITDGYGTVSTESDTNMAVLIDQPISLTIDKRGGSVENGTDLNSADFEFKVKGIFNNSSEEKTVTLNGANAGHLFKPNTEYILSETKAPYGYLKGADITIKFNEKGELILPADSTNQKVSGNAKDNLIYVDKPFNNICLYKMDADNSNKYLEGAEFTLTGTFADKAGRLHEGQGTATIVSEGAGKGVDISSVEVVISEGTSETRYLAQGQQYTLTETKVVDGYILPNPAPTITFTVTDEGKVTFTETGDITGTGDTTGTGTKDITAKNHKISMKLQKRDLTDGSALNTKVTIKDVTDPTTQPTREVTIDKDTVTYENEITKPFLIAEHRYEVWEAEADTPTGYVTPTGALATFTVGTDGSLTLESVGTDEQGNPLAEVTTGTNNISTLTLKNERKTGKIAIHKVDAEVTTTGLSGAVFNLYKDGSSDPLVIGGVTGSKDIITNADGKVTVSGLEWGTYVLKEITPPQGYVISDAMSEGIKFTISATSLNPTITSGATSEKIENSKNVFTLTKVDENGTKLPGAEFVITDPTDATKPKIVLKADEESKKDEYILEGMLIAGHTYELEETTAPDGYILETATVSFRMQNDGTIKAAGTEDWSNTGYSITNDNKGIQLKDVPIKVTIQKVDAKETKKLEGAVFSLTKENDSTVIETLTTGADGLIDITKGNLVQGQRYTLTETKAPIGYQLPDTKPSVTFTVGTDGTVTFADNTDTAVFSGTNSATITVKNTKTKVTIQKFGNESETFVPGAVLQILDEQNNVVKDMSGKDREWTTEAVAVNLEGLAAGTYTLHEKTAPDGYTTAKDITFTLAENNTITVKDAPVGMVSVENGNYVITMTDTLIRGHVELKKTLKAADETSEDKMLAGVTFDLYRSVKDGEDVKIAENLTTNEQGVWTSVESDAIRLDKQGEDTAVVVETLAKGLEKGDYYFKEVSVPDNSKLDADKKWTFTIAENGEDIYAQPDITSVDVTNDPFKTTIEFTKTEDEAHDYQTVEGAQFKLWRSDVAGPEDDYTLYKDGIVSDADGKVSAEIQDKGFYILKEVGNTGYEKDSFYKGTFRIVEEDYGQTLKLTSDNSGRIETVAGELVKDKGITNVRETGSVTLNKVDSEDATKALEGVTFKLQVYDKDGKSFVDKIKELFTGKKYNETGKEISGEQLATAGTLTIEGLDWGEYRLVETKAITGYENHDITLDFSITRDGSKSITLQTDGTNVTNEQNEVIVEKKGLANHTDKEEVLLTDARFTITKQGETAAAFTGTVGDGTTSELGRLFVKGILEGGATYVLHEVSGPEGYKLAPDVTFVMGVDGTVTVDEKVVADNVISVSDEQTYISFHKAGLLNETCADTTLGANVPGPDQTEALAGVTFTAYRDAGMTEKLQDAVSDANGLVEFWKLPLGICYIKETKTVEGHVLDENVYTANVTSDDTFEGLRLNGSAVKDNTIINDIYRTDIEFQKLDEKNPDKTIANSVYGLYKQIAGTRAASVFSSYAASAGADDQWVKIAEATTDANGILRFTGVLMDTVYQVRELRAPDGSYVSANPMEITFEMKDGKAVITKFDGGDGTAEVDPVTGEIIWKEPQVEVDFAKKDEDGKLLAGAKLEVQDEDGNVVESWTSSAEEVYTSYGKLVNGKTYKLVETEAPQGYDIAEPVTFTIPEEAVGPNENKVIQIEMIDKKTPVKSEDPKVPKDPAKKLAPMAKLARAVKTGDYSDVWGYAVTLLAAVAAIAAGVGYKKKRR